MAVFALLQATFFLEFLSLSICHGEVSSELLPLAPESLKVFPNSTPQRLDLQWRVQNLDHHKQVNMVFQIQISRMNTSNIIWMENYTTTVSWNQVLNWSWESEMPLECATHFVRIRGFQEDAEIPKLSFWSEWTSWEEVDVQKSLEYHILAVFPLDKLVEEGSNVTACCISRIPQENITCHFGPHQLLGEQLDTNVIVFNFNNVSPSNRTGTNFYCSVGQDANKYAGTILYVSKILEEPKNFSCETQDFKMLTCTWNPGISSEFSSKPTTQEYTLLESFSGMEMKCKNKDRCDWRITQESQEMYNITLVAKSDFRTRRVNLLFNLSHQVYPKPPFDLLFKDTRATSAVVTWKVGATPEDFTLVCAVELHSEGRMVQQRNVSVKVDGRCLLNDLEPDTKYETQIRCASADHFWKWSNGISGSFRTPEAAPSEAPDVWRSVKSVSGNQTVALFWKPLSKRHANGKILFYNIVAKNLDNPSDSVVESVPFPGNSTVLTLPQSPYQINVTAHNSIGTSPASVIGIFRDTENMSEDVKEERVNRTEEERVNGTEPGIPLSWRPPSSGDVTGYVVEWCEQPRELPCHLQWKSLGPGATSTVISSDAFKPGVRYSFKIYGISTNWTARLLEWKKGYSQETAPSNPHVTPENLTSHSFALSWNDYIPDSDSQPGFIQGYRVYLKSKDGNCQKGFEKINLTDALEFCRYTINNPEQKTFVVDGLKPELHEFLVTSFTSAGEGPRDTFKKVLIPYEHSYMLTRVLVPMILGILIFMMLCYLKSQWLKENCCPDIPDPCKSTAISSLKFKLQDNSHQTVMSIRDCALDDIEVIHKLDGSKMQASDNRESLTDLKLLKHIYLSVLPVKNSSEPDPCICFENLTYNQAASEWDSCGPIGVPPEDNTAEPMTAPENSAEAPGRTYITPLAEIPAEDTSLNYVAQLASPTSEDKDGLLAHSPEPALCTEYKMQMAIPLCPLSENTSVPSATLPDQGEHYR